MPEPPFELAAETGPLPNTPFGVLKMKGKLGRIASSSRKYVMQPGGETMPLAPAAGRHAGASGRFRFETTVAVMQATAEPMSGPDMSNMAEKLNLKSLVEWLRIGREKDG